MNFECNECRNYVAAALFKVQPGTDYKMILLHKDVIDWSAKI